MNEVTMPKSAQIEKLLLLLLMQATQIFLPISYNYNYSALVR